MTTWYGRLANSNLAQYQPQPIFQLPTNNNNNKNNALDLVIDNYSNVWGNSAHPSFLQNQHIDEKLSNACWNEDVKGAKDALEEGAHPSLYSHPNSLLASTPFFICCHTGNIEIAELLMQYRADVWTRDEFDGATALHIAIRNQQNAEFCHFLVSIGVDPNIRDKLGITALMDAAAKGDADVIKCLLDCNADINAEDRKHFSAFSYALDGVDPHDKDCKYWKCIKLLLKYGANPNFYGKYTGNSVLIMAVRRGDLEMVQQLMQQYGFMYNDVKDSDDKTAIMYAKELDNVDILHYLTEYGLLGVPGLCEMSCIVL